MDGMNVQAVVEVTTKTKSVRKYKIFVVKKLNKNWQLGLDQPD
jgi:hypothetical protein